MKKDPDDFSKNIAISIAFHVIIFLFLTVKVLFFPSESENLQSSVRIDVVALPDKVMPKPAAPPAEPEPAPIKKEEPKKEAPKKKIVKKEKPKKKKVSLEKKKKKKKKTKEKEVKKEQDSAIARLKALKNLREKNKKSKKPDFKGNQVIKGNSLSGLEKLHDESYKSDLETHIKSHWVLPEWLREGNYQAVVVILISKTGDITKKTFLTASGNKLFDEQVLSTLEKASPLPKPPSNLIDLYSNKGIRVSFP